MESSMNFGTHTRSAMAGFAPLFLDATTIRSLLPFPSLLTHLQSSLPSSSTSVQTPLRQILPLTSLSSSSLLLMPAWSSSYIGVKLVTSFPGNSSLGLPGVHAAYVLFDAATGATVAAMEGTQLTLIRTAVISALAAKFLAREDSKTLLMVGAGKLAGDLVRAHVLVRPAICRVFVWNRSPEKAFQLVGQLREETQFRGVEITVAEALTEEILKDADVISCATSSEEPLIMGRFLKKGAHLDLVGSFSASMRECDDVALTGGRVFVDSMAALEEAGELVGAFSRGVMSADDVAGTLVDLVGGRVVGRRGSEELTVFKSVGSAMVDLLAAQFAYESFLPGAR